MYIPTSRTIYLIKNVPQHHLFWKHSIRKCGVSCMYQNIRCGQFWNFGHSFNFWCKQMTWSTLIWLCLSRDRQKHGLIRAVWNALPRPWPHFDEIGDLCGRHTCTKLMIKWNVFKANVDKIPVNLLTISTATMEIRELHDFKLISQ